ncbi:glycosyltransferase family 25 protein [Xenorhabdus bovienii]|uniref:glycosyltransferase family 25 protein n=1 Tax=Xenorhabdus bovienii TaxID=40576 RepID=UPI00237CAEF4|nr:glycosyltransferase family 25 protein [Xenorhabdus bovienii]MDE1493762.1 glycosyltransferase family 25 protein [Xenorhabdus bovienii]MDE9471750.1 glycosyltransferase family 25 protein [Xenorhabdus bovienii]
MNYKIYVISLRNELIRRKSIKKQLDDYNLNYTLFDAIDLRKMTEEKIIYLCKNLVQSFKRKLTKGEIGCSLSHKALYEVINKNNNSLFTLIIEDDAIISKNLKETIENPMILKADWDIIILGYSKLANKDKKEFYRKEPIFKDFDIRNYHFGRVWKEWTCGTVGYLIKTTAAKKILEQKTLTVADDWKYYCNTLNLKILHCRPSLIDEDYLNHQSAIEKERSLFLKKHRKSLDAFRFARGYLRKLLMIMRYRKNV